MNSWIRRRLGVAALVILVLVVAVPQASAHEASQKGTVTVMTRNLYLGTELGPIFSAPTLPGLFSAVEAGYADVQATSFPARAALVANEIAVVRPDLVGLQEVALFKIDVPPDGPATPATQVTFDYLALLLAELELRGLEYEPVAIHVGTDAEIPAGFPPTRDVRMTLRDVTLVRRDAGPTIHVEGAESGTYSARIAVPTAAGPVTAKRGWNAVDVKLRGRHFRFVNTHLEAFSGAVQTGQAAELAAGPAAVDRPVIIVGDLNSRSDGSTTPSYANLIAAGFADAWSGPGGLTCCHERPALREAVPSFYERIDYVLTRGPFETRDAWVVGDDEQANRSATGLWPSDHAGVVAALRLSGGPR